MGRGRGKRPIYDDGEWNKHPEALPGFPVGAHGLVVIDCDRKGNGVDGVQAFETLCKREGINLSQSFAVSTPSKGVHFYYRTETPYGNSRGSLPDGIDVRGRGGYVIAPGATLPDNRTYRIEHGTWDAIPALPEALAGYLRPKVATVVAGASVASPASARDRDYAATVLDAEIAALTSLRPGNGRNDALNQAAFALGTLVGNGSLDGDVTAQALYEAAAANGHVAKRGETQTRDTITSGLNAGIAKPRASLTIDGPMVDVDSMVRNDEIRRSDKPLKPWPEALSAEAYIGLAGEFIRLVAPETEGDPCALLIAFLTAMGSIMGRDAYMQVGATRHHANLFTVLVAESSKGRKGTVMDETKRFAKMVDSTIESRMRSGLSSGEGLIEAVRDPRHDDAAPAKKDVLSRNAIVDKGVEDKRLLVTESEMGGALQAAGRDGNTLSATLRLAWDGDTLQTLARSNKNVCREPHISIFGNITLDELQRLLTSTDRNNGFANRFLWVCARRSQALPWGGKVDVAALQTLANRAAVCLVMARHYGSCGWLPDAASLWAKEYPRLSDGRPGLAGAMSARAEAQTLRMALIYAVIDGSNNIDVPHLRAALEVWRYCQESVDYCFGSTSGNATSDSILKLLISTPEGATLTQVSNHFGRNRKSAELQAALATLKAAGKAWSESRKTGGKAAEVWFST